MNLTDIIFWGWHRILDKTIYAYKTGDGIIGPKEHSFFITFLFHGINVWTILRFLAAKYFSASIPLFPSLALAVFIFLLGYLSYIRGNRGSKVASYDVNGFKAFFFIILSIAYVAAATYFMFQVGNYVREQKALGMFD